LIAFVHSSAQNDRRCRPRGRQFAGLFTVTASDEAGWPDDGQPFGVGRIWDGWQGDDESYMESCAVITTAANEVVQPINDRMPVIIAPEDYDRWLDPEFYDAEELERMMGPWPSEGMLVSPG
jgi:putative SOS response-associated peptidase YedK